MLLVEITMSYEFWAFAVPTVQSKIPHPTGEKLSFHTRETKFKQGETYVMVKLLAVRFVPPVVCSPSIFHADEAPFPLRPLALTSNDRRE